ncbi:hypothetical protein BDQ12DRAFT_111223 [Crucibulum laeve]|uniref:Uncharacterized protein n=1 Tax=Crucibulum laeve TaxID=68775 RepID=A0A5C3M091_9AGAR|nr:hypothetical protein BDQ12DRAFT_111223 [Crucibulum laeve]
MTNSGSHSLQGVEHPTKAITATIRSSPSPAASSSSQWRCTEGPGHTQQARIQKKRKVQTDFSKLNITGEEETALNEQPWYNGLNADNYISPAADIKMLYTCGVNGCTIKIQGDRHNIAAHMKMHTFTPITQANSKEKVLCGDANHQPLLRSDMDKHFRDRHFLSGSHSCSICHAVSVNDYSARRHVKETCFPRKLQAFREERAADSEASSSKRARRK